MSLQLPASCTACMQTCHCVAVMTSYFGTPVRPRRLALWQSIAWAALHALCFVTTVHSGTLCIVVQARVHDNGTCTHFLCVVRAGETGWTLGCRLVAPRHIRRCNLVVRCPQLRARRSGVDRFHTLDTAREVVSPAC